MQRSKRLEVSPETGHTDSNRCLPADRLWPDLSPVARAQKPEFHPAAFGLHDSNDAEYWAQLARALDRRITDRSDFTATLDQWAMIDRRRVGLWLRAIELAETVSSRWYVNACQTIIGSPVVTLTCQYCGHDITYRHSLSDCYDALTIAGNQACAGCDRLTEDAAELIDLLFVPEDEDGDTY